MADAYSLVGFQNHLRYGEQARVLRLIPGLQNAEFLQFGQIHRNTYICSPRVLQATMQCASVLICSSPDRSRELKVTLSQWQWAGSLERMRRDLRLTKN
jgi:hypothetical protein